MIELTDKFRTEKTLYKGVLLKGREDGETGKTLSEALVQTMQYMDTFGCREGWLVIFDQRSYASWDDKIFLKKELIEGKTATVTGM